MKAGFIQTHANLSAAYSLISDGVVKYHAEIPLNFKGSHAGFFEGDRLRYKLCFDRLESIKGLFKGRVAANMFPFSIWSSDDELVGHAYLKRSKAFFGYMYFEYVLNGKTFYAYEVGMGKQGIKIPIYDEDKQIALIEKGVVVYDNKDEYEIVGIDDYAIEVAALFNLYYDFVRFGRYGQVVYKSKEVSYLYTINKELKNKYDQTFKKLYEY